MLKICKTLPLLLLASALSLSSCVNEVKNPPKALAQDTVAIVYSIPDSNNILIVDFHAAMTSPWQKNFRLDWNFGDSTGIISKFDTSNLTHYYQKFGSYVVTLSVFDTVLKNVLGKTSVLLDLIDNPIDTNFLHGFTKVKIYFSGKGKYSGMDTALTSIIYNSSAVQWLNHQFSAPDNYSYHTVTPDPNYGNDLITSGAGKTIFISTISYSGYRIQSGIYQTSSFQQQGYKFGPGPYGGSVQTNLMYVNLPLISKNTDSMVYSFKGSQLQTQITQIQDSSTSTNSGTVFGTVVLQSILWDQQPPPILTVTFSK
jgi:hypothetical protein